MFCFWPHDFTFACPTAIAAFNSPLGDFTDRDTKVYGISADSHFARRQANERLRDLKFTLLADSKLVASSALRKRVGWLSQNASSSGWMAPSQDGPRRSPGT
ncbi:MAG: redoxin domain-containing protein [Candidatus Sericytochromatia bacterium]|nr:redoxin domain-containing protein [Candidatus Sericytochromatia bacterium]